MAGGIETLPVLLGMRLSQRLIGAFFFICYVLVGKMFNEPLMLFFSVAAGGVQFFLINRKVYKEWPVFVVYLLSLGVVIFNLGKF